jgi:hypothetical protein
MLFVVELGLDSRGEDLNHLDLGKTENEVVQCRLGGAVSRYLLFKCRRETIRRIARVL